MPEKQILARAIGIQKEIGVNYAFFRDNETTIIILKSGKIQSNTWRFFFQIGVALKLVIKASLHVSGKFLS